MNENPEREDSPLSQREILAAYLRYALPEVAAINPGSALLLDQAIMELTDTPNPTRPWGELAKFS